MAELIADLFVTLDGFAAGVDAGPFFGYSGPELGSWVSDALGQPQLVVMGRVTYQALAAISSPATDEVSTRMTELPKVVVSNTLAEPLAWANTRHLVEINMRHRLADHFHARAGPSFNRGEIRHRAGRKIERRFPAEDFRGASLEPIDGRILGVHVVADFGFGHGAAHSGGGAGYRVAAEVDYGCHSGTGMKEISTT